MADTDLLMPPVGGLTDEDEQRKRLLDPYHSVAMPAASLKPAAPASPASSPSGMPPVGSPLLQRSEPLQASSNMPPSMPSASGPMPAPHAAPSMSAAPVAPVQAASQSQEPQLHGWKKALDVVGSMFPIGRAVETAIPGTPQNFNMQQALQAARGERSQKLERGQQEIDLGKQALDKGAAAAQFDTPEKRRGYMGSHPDEFGDLSDFQKNDFVLSGKFPQREPVEKPQDVVKQYSDALAAGDTAKAETLKPRVQEFMQNTQKPAADAGKDKDISDYMEANKLEDTAANRETARGAIAKRGKPEVNDTDAKDIANAIMHGDQPPTTTGLYRNAALVRAELARNGFNLARAESDWHATQKHLSTLNGQQQERLRQAVSFTADSLGIIEGLYDQWKKVGNTSGWKTFNKASLATAKQLPGEPGNIAHRLEAQINDLTSELGTVYKGGNSSTDESLKLAAGNLAADWNEKTFKDAIGQIRQNLDIRQNSIRHSQPAGVSADSPYTPHGEKAATKSWNPATGKYE